MNLTELARKLKVPPTQLLENLPKLGFDVGKKAIKVDDRVASKILRTYSNAMRDIEKREKEQKKQEEIKEAISAAGKEVGLPPELTVRELAGKLFVSVPLLMTELMKNGILSSVNERLDFETASVIAEDLGFTVIQKGDSGTGAGTVAAEEKLKKVLTGSSIEPRPPVVVVMGHVDHGKTTLLDAIRKTDVVASEAGGITQHIGAYQVEYDGQQVTFIDTPGHEAFRAMRSRGAKVADVAILIVAADDGIKPQTKEAYNIIKGAGLPFVVAINKIDKPEADIERVKGELGTLDLIPEDWGGKTICVSLSAKSGEGIDKLLEMVLLVADLHQEKIMADPSARAFGSVIEAHVDSGEGPVATILVQNGTLKVGDYIIHGDMLVGRARVLKNHRNEEIDEAPPSTPVRILGLKDACEVGDVLEVGDPDKAKRLSKKKKIRRSTTDIITAVEEGESSKQIPVPVLLKADVLGSLEAIIESVDKLDHPDVKAQIIGKGLGNITEGDVLRAASTTESFIAGFHVQVTREARELADEQKVEIKIYEVIYDLIAYIKERLNAKLTPEVIITVLGSATVLAIFRQEPKRQVIGAQINKGLLKPNSMVKVYRGDEYLGEGKLSNLQAGKEAVSEAAEGVEAGMQIEGAPKIIEGDKLEFYIREEQKRVIV